jgi:DNA invertase Pin-like site-specific DNA recombinase
MSDKKEKKKVESTVQPSKVYAYMRTSKVESDIEHQENAIVKYCNDNNLHITSFIEDASVSGYKVDWKNRKLYKLITETCKKGDTIVVFDVTRFARKMLDVFSIANICTEKKINFIDITHKLIFEYNPKNIQQQLTNTIMLSVLAMASEIERSLISERSKSSLNNKKEKIEKGEVVMKKQKNVDDPTYELKGVCGKVRVVEKDGEKVHILRKGTHYKSKLDVHKDTIIKGLKEGFTQTEISKYVGCSVPTLSKYIERNKLKPTLAKKKKTDAEISEVLSKGLSKLKDSGENKEEKKGDNEEEEDMVEFEMED